VAKPKNSFEVMAIDAAKRIQQARDIGQQLTFLPDEAGAPPVDTIDRKAGRPVGAKNKASSQMRDWLVTHGYRMPEDQLAQMAGLASQDSAIITAMQQAEQVLTWAYQNSKDKDGQPMLPSPQQRMAAFAQLYTQMLRAADALLPYGAPKATPDAGGTTVIPIMMTAGPMPVANGSDARVIGGDQDARLRPPNAHLFIEENQQVANEVDEKSDDKSRTE